MTSAPPENDRRRVAMLLAALALGGMTAGCSTVEPRPLSPALFPAAPGLPGTKDATRLGLSLADPAQSFTNPPVRMRFAGQVQVPLGRIVEAAALMALGEQFESVALGLANEPQLRVRVSDVTADLTSDLIYIIPIPGGVIDRVDVTTRLAFRLAVVAPDGSTRWTQDQDSGRELLKLKRENLLVQESLPDGIQRAFHQQAVRLMRQSAAELRAWLLQEGLRERVL